MKVQPENSQWPPVDTLVATLFYLTSRFAFSQNFSLIQAIDMHFSMLERHPETSPVIAKTSRQLREQWLSQMNEIDLSGDLRTSPLHRNASVDNIH